MNKIPLPPERLLFMEKTHELYIKNGGEYFDGRWTMQVVP